MQSSLFAIVGLYAALNVVLLLWLSGATARLRHRYHVLIGDGGVQHLARVMRGQANAAENMPMMFVLLIAAAALGAPALALHLLGAAFTLGRALHALHFVQESAPQWQRSVGFGLGGLAMIAAALGVLAHALVLLV